MSAFISSTLKNFSSLIQRIKTLTEVRILFTSALLLAIRALGRFLPEQFTRGCSEGLVKSLYLRHAATVRPSCSFPTERTA